jgi:hypothetical protein
MDRKCATAYPLPTGTSLQNSPLATRTPFPGSIYLHTPSMLIVAFILHFAIEPMPMHYAPLPIAATIVFILDNKRSSGIIRLSTPFLSSQEGPDRYPSGENCDAMLVLSQLCFPTCQSVTSILVNLLFGDLRRMLLLHLHVEVRSSNRITNHYFGGQKQKGSASSN